MEKYAKLMKGLEVCAGPECCKDACPYYGETRGGKTCRAWLLNDAAAAIANEEAGSETLQELLQKAETERNTLRGGLDNLGKAYQNLCTVRDALAAENKALHDEIDALVLKTSEQEDKTDRPSACDKELVEEVGKLIAQAKYQEGKADALEWFLREWFREGGFQE